MEERELELPGLPQACDITPVSWSNLYSADQMRAYGAECARQAVLAERERCERIAIQKAEGIERVNTYRGKVNQASQHAADMVRDVAAAIRKG